MYLMSVAINVLLMFYYKNSTRPVDLALNTLIVVDLFTSIYVCSMVALRNVPVLIAYLNVSVQPKKTNLKSWISYIFNFSKTLLFEDEFGFYLLYLVANILSLRFNPLFCIVHLSFIVRIDLLSNVVSAVWLRRWQLLLSFLLLIMIFYYFALLGFSYISTHYPLRRCEKLIDCIISTFDLTFKDGGGIGVFLKDIWKVYAEEPRWPFYMRFFYDSILAIILVNVLLNIVTGIIIDEFASLKDAMNDRLEDTRNVCYMCGLDRELFERNNIDFEEHIKKDHYKWNYIYYIVYLASKPKSELTGTEGYVARKLEEKSIDWLPVYK